MINTHYFQPPFPAPHEQPPNVFQLFWSLNNNPLDIWSKRDFIKPMLVWNKIIDHRILLSDPEGIRHVLLDNSDNYKKNDLQLRLLKPALGNGVITEDGDNWKHQRQIMTSQFSPKQLQSYARLQLDIATKGLEKINSMADASEIDITKEMGLLTLNMLTRTLFTQSLEDKANDFQRAVTQYLNIFTLPGLFDLLGLPQQIPRWKQWRGRAVKQFLNQTVDNIIETRRHLISTNPNVPHDMLTQMLITQENENGMSDQVIKDNIVTLIGAGHETTTNALTWTFYLLSQSTEWRSRVEQEVDTQFDISDPIGSLPVTKAVLEEAMRLYPPVPMMSRVAVNDDIVCEQEVRAGSIIMISPYVLHRHQTLWDEPNAFNPDRFLGENRQKINKFSYIPFGMGPRLCIGMSFAMTEMLIILATWLAKYRFTLSPDHTVMPEVRLTMRPQNGMKMIVTRRDS